MLNECLWCIPKACDSSLGNEDDPKPFCVGSYRVLSQPDTNSALFTVNNKSGLLLSAARLDREALCHFTRTCRLHLYVAIQQSSGPYFVTVKVNVNLLDINDNDPQFPQASMAVPVMENTWTESIDIVPAMDMDIGQNTIQNYELVTPGGSDHFRLEVTPNLDGSLVPSLVVKTKLDRERQRVYELVVLAKDGGSPVRTGVLTLNITVGDANDNAPVFAANEYDVSVNETLPRDTVIVTVTASDRDVGFNGEVRYRFSPRQIDDNANAFTIHETTGEIRSVQELTHLQRQTLHLVVEAVDRGSKPLKAQAMVNVKVLDAVNNYPAIRLSTTSGGNISMVKESAPAGYVVAHFIVVDTDSGTNGIVSCAVSSGSSFSLQKLVDKEYKITLLGSLNREQKDRFDVTVRCWDFGRPNPLTSVVSFNIIVDDVNDNAPIFSQKLYRRNVTEEQGPGVLMRVQASDADVGENGRVTYRLGNVSAFMTTLITVREHSGEIVSKRSLDREMYKVVDFIVVAQDHGTPRNSATARVILNIVDINDRKPSLPMDYSLQVMENQPAGTMVGVIKAIDEDEGNSGTINYHLLSDNNATRFFSLAKTGEVKSKSTFDRESKDFYHLSVLANDLGDPPNTNILTVTVQIMDDNDNTPRFERPNDTTNLVNISATTLARSVIFRAKAKDADTSLNAVIDFGLASDNYGTFAINRSSGVVSTIRNLHPADSGTYSLVLLARDRGTHGARSAIATLTVVVLAENATTASMGHINEDHVIIVAVLVCLTVLTAACVTVILLRLRHSDRQARHLRHHGLPPESKAAYHLHQVKGDASLHRAPGDGGEGVGGRIGGGRGGGGGADCGKGGGGGSWSGYDVVKGHAVEETGQQELGQDSEDDLLLFKLKLAQQYKDKDRDYASSAKNSRAPHLDKPQADELMSSSSRETNATDSGRGCSEDDSQAVESVRSENESGFSSFKAMPLKDGWRHVENPNQNQEYVNSPQTSLKTVIDAHSPVYPSFAARSPSLARKSASERPSYTSTYGYPDLDTGHMYENTHPDVPNHSSSSSSSSNYATTPKKSLVRTVENPAASKTSLYSRSREPRFQPQFHSSRARANVSTPASSLSDYVNSVKSKRYGSSGSSSCSGGMSPTKGLLGGYGDSGCYGKGGEVGVDSLNDSGDTADEGNTTTSGSYTMEHEEEDLHDQHGDMFV
ncbi:hypothetical protein ACOMHN_042202 [Nucella lapillus]